MNGATVPWFEQNDPRDLRRWILAALIVVGIHLAAIAAYVYVHKPDEIGDDEAPIAVDFSPGADTVDQSEVDPTPEQPPPQVEKPPPPPPPPAPPEVQDVVPLPEPPPPPKVEEPAPQAPAQTAKAIASAPKVSASWESGLEKHLQRFKRYPNGAQARGEEGVVLLDFTVDRNGRVLAHEIAKSSGHPELDAEVMSMIERAQPLPAFPTSMSEPKLDLTVPIRFSLR